MVKNSKMLAGIFKKLEPTKICQKGQREKKEREIIFKGKRGETLAKKKSPKKLK